VRNALPICPTYLFGQFKNFICRCRCHFICLLVGVISMCFVLWFRFECYFWGCPWIICNFSCFFPAVYERGPFRFPMLGVRANILVLFLRSWVLYNFVRVMFVDM
jgi:hypothetical protein